MNIREIFGVTIFLCSLRFAAFAADVDDCLLNGLKGINSDAGARMVRQACENKVANRRREQLSTKYGDAMDAKLTFVDWDANYSKGNVKVALKNDLLQTVMYAELSVSMPSTKGECTYQDTRKYLYALKIKPGSNAMLIVPEGTSKISKEGRTCISLRAVRGREPSILDVSIGSVEPLSDNQVGVINRELNENYAATDLPVFVPLKMPLQQQACDAEVSIKYPHLSGADRFGKYADCIVRSIK